MWQLSLVDYFHAQNSKKRLNNKSNDWNNKLLYLYDVMVTIWNFVEENIEMLVDKK